MEDRFRFRSWDSSISFMGYFSWFESSGYTELDDPSITLMQCSGLKDKNGKLIYEGDIVSFYDYPLDCVGAVLFETYSDAEQYADQSHLGWSVRYTKYNIHDYRSTLPDLATNNTEVVGNIYEHPHLLKNSES
jgi:uncharacterized phage protein (TIGR01671 family)